MQLRALLQQVTFLSPGLNSAEIQPTEQNTHMLQKARLGHSLAFCYCGPEQVP